MYSSIPLKNHNQLVNGIPTYFFIVLPSRRAAGVIALDLEMAPVLARLCCGCCLAFFVVSLADRAEGLGLVVREI